LFFVLSSGRVVLCALLTLVFVITVFIASLSPGHSHHHSPST
jgi:hypothetical protein